MTCRVPLGLVLLAAWPQLAAAQSPASDPTQQLGHRLFIQSCGVCHTKPNLTAGLYAPALHRETVTGKEDGARQLISLGTEHMPGFRYELSAPQIDAIIAYLKTLPPPAEPAAPAHQHDRRMAD
jgi:mono/diheme cytochrome c family protein